MASNYEKMLLSARELFLERDQRPMIDLWDLEHDGDWLYMDYFGQRLKLDRRTAEVSYAREPGPGDFRAERFINASMVLFDLLTFPSVRPRAAGSWSSISALAGIIGAGHDRNLSHEDTAAKFSGKAGVLARACERLGGVPFGKADVGYAVPVFRDFAVLFQFWDGDDEFPATIKYLYDANARRYMHYETLWYVMGDLADRLDFYVNGTHPAR